MKSEDQPRSAPEAAVPERDEDVADIFRTMRKALGLSPSALAQKLKTQTSVLLALEKGNLAQLPEWEETSRVVNTYAAMMGLDCRPILRRIAIRKAEQNELGDDPAEAASSRSLGSGRLAAMLVIALLCLTLLAALAVAFVQWRAPVGSRGDSAHPAAALPVPGAASSTAKGAGGTVTVRRVPLPQAIEAPASKDGVDREPANSDNTPDGVR